MRISIPKQKVVFNQDDQTFWSKSMFSLSVYNIIIIIWWWSSYYHHIVIILSSYDHHRIIIIIWYDDRQDFSINSREESPNTQQGEPNQVTIRIIIRVLSRIIIIRIRILSIFSTVCFFSHIWSLVRSPTTCFWEWDWELDYLIMWIPGTSNIQIWYPISDIQYLISYIQYPISNIQHPISCEGEHKAEDQHQDQNQDNWSLLLVVKVVIPNLWTVPKLSSLKF